VRKKRAAKSNQVYLIVLLFILLLAAIVVIQAFSTQSDSDPRQAVYFNTDPTEIIIASPKSGGVISSPLVISGLARGHWYFEAVFHAALVNWDGLIISESYVAASSDWMSENLVPFRGAIEFEIPYEPSGDLPEFMKRGTLILRKANPSGLPQHDGGIEVPVRFE